MKKQKPWMFFYCLTAFVTLLTVQLGSRAITVFVETSPMDREQCIVIDAGHGGIDGGATSCTGKLESTFNLEIALRLRDLLHFLGYETKMIRTADISVYREGETIAQKKISDLKERVRMVNEIENALLLSIHQNQFPEGKYSGAQIFYAETEDSDILAEQLQSAFRKTLNPGSKRQSKKSNGVYLMEHINCTGVLIECGFLSNAEEEAKLRNPEYQKKVCCVIAATLNQYLNSSNTVA